MVAGGVLTCQSMSHGKREQISAGIVLMEIIGGNDKYTDVHEYLQNFNEWISGVIKEKGNQ